MSRPKHQDKNLEKVLAAAVVAAAFDATPVACQVMTEQFGSASSTSC